MSSSSENSSNDSSEEVSSQSSSLSASSEVASSSNSSSSIEEVQKEAPAASKKSKGGKPAPKEKKEKLGDDASSSSDSDSAAEAEKIALVDAEEKKQKQPKKTKSTRNTKKSSSDSDSDSAAEADRIELTKTSKSSRNAKKSVTRPSVPHAADPRLSLVGERPSRTDTEEEIPRTSLVIARTFEEQKQREGARLKAEKAGKKGGKDKKGKEPKREHVVEAHTWDTKRLSKEFGTNLNSKDVKKSKGLTTAQVDEKIAAEGLNKLSAVSGDPLWLVFLKEFIQFFPLLLEVGGVLCLIAYALDSSVNDNLYLGIVLLLVVVMTAIFSFMQQAKSASMMEGFADMNPDQAKVIRDGQKQTIDAERVVRGDIVEISAGDRIPADLVMLWTDKLKVNNSSLTGENEPVSRTSHQTDENYLESHNLSFSSALVEEGDGLGVVYAIGDFTEIGHIANLTSDTEKKDTPLRSEVARFIKIVSAVAIFLGVSFLIAALIILQPIEDNWVAAIVFAIGIIVANVPEGLLPTLTVALTLTAKKLSRKKVLVKNLEAVETLGSCSTICSDKTGTLTLNQMTAVACYYDGDIWSTDRETMTKGAVDPAAHPTYRTLRLCAALNNRTDFDRVTEGNMDRHPRERECERQGGNASEIALTRMVGMDEDKADFVDLLAFREAHPMVFEIPFNSDNKWQLSIHEQPENLEEALISASKGKKVKQSKKPYVLTMKGATERVCKLCSNILQDGKVRPITEADVTAMDEANATLASTGRRVLGFATLILDEKTFPHVYQKGFKFDIDEDNYPRTGLTFVGMVGLMDPPRPEVPQAIIDCHTAGIRVIMVTGDHPLTAEAIAREVGILTGDTPEQAAARTGKKLKRITAKDAPAIVIKGSDIPSLTEDDWNNILERKEVVFARTSPEQKLQIVAQCQDRGAIVAVTGDGVNDSPALRQADLGCAMGITGTAVAKEAADIILMDDNFASIVVGVRQGRIIFNNLKKSITYTLSSNFAELLPFVFFMVAGLPLALSAVLILCIDLGTDMVPAIALAYEKPEKNIMQRPPRDPIQDRLVTLKLAVFSYLWLGFIQAIAGFMGFFLLFADKGFTSIAALLGSTWQEFFLRNNAFIELSSDGSFTKFQPDLELAAREVACKAMACEDAAPAENATCCYDQDAQLEILAQAQTAFFVGVVVVRIGCIFVCKSRMMPLWEQGIVNNPYLDAGVLFEIILAICLTYVPPLNTVFGTRPIPGVYWVYFLPFTLFAILADEVRKKAIRTWPENAFMKFAHW